MKIISPFKDFYDRALAYGHDDHVVLVRKTEELYNSHDSVLRSVKMFDHLFEDFAYNSIRGAEECTISFDYVVILFCGKTYRGIRVTRTPSWTKVQDVKSIVVYDGDALKNVVMNFGGDIDVDHQKRGRFWWGRQFFYNNSIRTWLSNQGTTEHQEFAITNKFTALVVDGGSPTRVINNARLADYDFFRVIDPATAYQELDMFISGVLPSASNQMVVTEDKYKIQAAGFDDRSFRKSPSKNRKTQK